MRRVAGVVLVLVAGVALGAGCGSTKTKVAVITVTHTTGPSTSDTSTSTSSSTTTTATPPATTSTTTLTVATQTSSGPASASGSGGAGVSAAEATAKAQGYTPTVTYGYKPDNTLGVILGTRAAGDQRAFFFVRGKFIGTDTKDPSAGITLTGQDDTSVTLEYALYKPDDKLCCPSGHGSVTYALDNGKLEPQGTIPSASTSASLSRR